MKTVAIVLTLNEENHIRRCIESIQQVTNDILVVDSFSTDRTCEIAGSLNSKVLKHIFLNYASQFNWAIDQVDHDADWVMRVDADEVISKELACEINRELPELPENIAGVYFPRSFVFLGQRIRHGGASRIEALRLWRAKRGRCENRWMDEHIIVDGATVSFSGDLIDHNLNPLSWWTAKHNSYSNREAVDLLNLKYGFMPVDSVASLTSGTSAGLKRWVKERVYARLPIGLRAFGYFLYRYFFALGFLDGRAGLVFHFLQGFWYRFLVDAKVYEVERHMALNKCGVVQAIREVLGIDLSPKEAGRS